MSKVTFDRDRFEVFISKQVLDICKDIAYGVKEDIQEQMRNSPPDDSKTYYHYGFAHNPSFPGKPPRIESGQLHDSISVNWYRSGMSRGIVGARAKRDDGIFQPKAKGEVLVGTNATRIIGKGAPAPYWLYLETGTDLMKARPYLEKNLKKARKLTDKATKAASARWESEAKKYLKTR